ncbi:MAG: hypothetical protein OEV08_09090 [Nitrospira sp.]|nr:hypothetical protein [Nitrospira sp.]
MLAAACASPQDGAFLLEGPPVEAAIQAPRVNKPLRPIPVPDHRGEARLDVSRVQLPARATDIVLTGRPELSMRGVPVNIAVAGKVELKEGLLSLRPNDGSAPLNLLFRTPKDLPKPSSLPREVRFDYADHSNKAGIKRSIILSDDTGKPLFAEIWQTSRNPLHVDLGNGLSLEQMSGDMGNTSQTVPVALSVKQNGAFLGTVQFRKPATFKTHSGAITIFIEFSLRKFTPESQENAGALYILKAWAIAESAAKPALQGSPSLRDP